MILNTTLKRWLFVGILIYSGWFIESAVAVESGASDAWQKIDTYYTTIEYRSLKDINKFEKRINFSPEKSGLKSLFTASRSKDAVESLKKEIDEIFVRVQDILDMRGKIIKPVIRLYPDKKSLQDVHFKLTGEKLRTRAWYVYEHNTISVNVQDVDEGLLAYMLTHAIADRYLKIRFPRSSVETLARYVDKHLFF